VTLTFGGDLARCYARLLASRIINFSSASDEAEMRMMKHLRQVCGFQYAMTLQVRRWAGMKGHTPLTIHLLGVESWTSPLSFRLSGVVGGGSARSHPGGADTC
jgi:hypothetical protein